MLSRFTASTQDGWRPTVVKVTHDSLVSICMAHVLRTSVSYLTFIHASCYFESATRNVCPSDDWPNNLGHMNDCLIAFTNLAT